MTTGPEPRRRGDVAALRIERDEPAAERKSVSRSAVVWIVVIAVAVVFALLVYEQWIAPRRYPVVETMTVHSAAVDSGAPTLTATGYLVADRQAVVAPKIPGRVARLNFDIGSKVQGGEPLAILESDALQAQLREADAVYEDARKEYRRQKALHRQGITSRSNLDAAEAQLKVAEAKKTQTEVSLRDTVVVAPFTGTVIAKNTEIGEIVSPVTYAETTTAPPAATSIATVSDLSTLEVEADVSESNVGRLTVGSPAEISVDAFPGRKWSGVLRKVIPAADRAKGVVKVRVSIIGDKNGLVPDMSAAVSFPNNGKVRRGSKSIWVPAEAVISDPSGARVMVIDEQNRAMTRPVVIGQSGAGRVELRSGVQEGERIVTSDADTLTPGQHVRISK